MATCYFWILFPAVCKMRRRQKETAKRADIQKDFFLTTSWVAVVQCKKRYRFSEKRHKLGKKRQQKKSETGRLNFPIITGWHGKLSPAATRKCPWPTPQPLLSSHPSATINERRAISRIKLQFYSPSMVHYPLYRGRHPHLGLKS